MNLATARPAVAALGTFHEYVNKKDYVGALAFIDFGEADLDPVNTLLWDGFCASRLGAHDRAKEAYLELLSDKFAQEDVPKTATLFLAIAYLDMGQYTDAEESALSVAPDAAFDRELKSRVLLQIAAKTKEEAKLSKYRQMLELKSKEDKLSAAAVEFSSRHRYQEAVDVYKSILACNVDDLALYVYTAMALFHMSAYDQSLEALSIYCQGHPDSILAANLKACSMYQLCDGDAALEVIDAHCDDKTKEEHDLVRHNIVAFKGGEKALRVLPGLVDKIPEAKLNLAIYYLRHGELDASAELIGDMEADSPQSHIVLGILNTELAQVKGDPAAQAKAKHHFQRVGKSSTECDTILGRQCMASYFYLMNQFDDTIYYLESIKPYLEDDGEFNWNYGISLAASGKYAEGLAFLLKVTDESHTRVLHYVLWLAKCHINTNHPEEAWECYLQTDDAHISYELLQLMGNECYRGGGEHFFYAARSFHELLKTDSYPDYLDGLMGAGVGYFRYFLVAKNNKGGATRLQNMKEVIGILESSALPQGQKLAALMKPHAHVGKIF